MNYTKLKQVLTITLLMSTLGIIAQNVKTKYQNFKYELLPYKPLPANYKTYKVTATNESTDGVPLNSKFVYIGEEYIKGLQNTSITFVKSGVMIGGAVIGKEPEQPKDIPSNLLVTFSFKNIEMLDKREFINKPTNPQTNVIENYLTYRLTFKFAYQLKVYDNQTQRYLLDTLIEAPKTTLFPSDYRYDAYGNKQYAPGYTNKPDLDADYNRNGKDLYANSKMILAKVCMDEGKEILKQQFGYDWKSYTLAISRVKAKSPVFDICDTTSNLMDNILDSISFNTKKSKHLNWHTPYIKQQAKKLSSIWEDMITDSKYLNEFKDPRDKAEFINKTKRSLIAVYLFQDNFDKALAMYNEVEPTTHINVMGQSMPDDNMKPLLLLIDRDRKLYDKHKQAFNFN
ncbi:MAG: hypothetical protein U0W65_00185 [Bacteroidia bacterium]